MLELKDKETLSRAVAFYYENYVWTELLKKDSSSASEEDYNLRRICKKLELKLPDRTSQGL